MIGGATAPDRTSPFFSFYLEDCPTYAARTTLGAVLTGSLWG